MRVNYDTIADRYDVPERDYDADLNLLAFLTETGATAARCRALDLGCGTGKQLAANHRVLPEMRKVGVDRSAGMLGIARRRCADVTWIQGNGSELPLASAAFDYVTSQFSYPHIGHTRGLLEEVLRVLRPGGRFVMTNIDPWSMRGWAIYHYFPEAFGRDCRDFLPAEQFADLMKELGFDRVRVTRESRPWRKTLAELQTLVRERYRASQLMVISGEEYAAGLGRLREDLDRGGLQDTPREYEFVLVTIMGDRATGHRATW
jgi:SAM-dependent methyltransferase